MITQQKSLIIIDKVVKSNKIIIQAIIIETINLIGKCKGWKLRTSICKSIKDNYIIYNKNNLLCRAMKEFIVYDGTLSFTECTALISMKDLNNWT